MSTPHSFVSLHCYMFVYKLVAVDLIVQLFFNHYCYRTTATGLFHAVHHCLWNVILQFSKIQFCNLFSVSEVTAIFMFLISVLTMSNPFICASSYTYFKLFHPKMLLYFIYSLCHKFLIHPTSLYLRQFNINIGISQVIFTVRQQTWLPFSHTLALLPD